MMGQKGKQYGLIKTAPSKQQQQQQKPVAKPIAAFGGGSDSDDDDTVEQAILRQGRKKVEDKKVAAMQAAALEQDASVFDYDGVYDAMQQERVQPRQQEKLQRQSKYIANLLDKAVERKREQDIAFERQQAREREMEEAVLGHKDKFVTSAYRRKLEEDKLWQQQQKQREEQEAAEEVTKRGHIGDFYRNLLTSNVAFGGAAKTPAAAVEPLRASSSAGPSGEKRQGGKDQGEEEAEPDGLAHMARQALQAAQAATGQGARGVGDTGRDTEGARAQEAGREAVGGAEVGGAVSGRQAGLDARPPAGARVGGEGGEGAGQMDAPGPGTQGLARHTEAAPQPPAADKAAAARERYMARKRKAEEGKR